MAKTNNSMKKGMIILLLVLIVPMVSAEVEYFSNKLFIPNESSFNYSTIRNSAFLSYNKDASDYIKNNNPLEVYIDYRTFLKTWNNSTDILDVDSCNLVIFYLPAHSNDISIVLNESFYPNQSDISSKKYFQKLEDKDAMRVQADCYFSDYQSLNPTYDLDMPLEFSYNTPTWACKSCQFFEWERSIRDVDKATLLGGNTQAIITYIQRLVVINYSIIKVLFWFFAIMLFYVALNLLFSVVYFGYLHIKKFAV
jgi:hypothetical protein